MKRPLCWISLGCFAAAAAFCSFYPAKEWVFPAIALFGLSGLFCLLSTRTRPAAIFSFSAAFMLLFCLLYGRLFAKPALDLSGRTLSLSGTVLETGRACFLLDGRDRKRSIPERTGLVQQRYGAKPVPAVFRHNRVVRNHLHRPV